MSDEVVKPYPLAAVFCEKVLVEEDNVLTAVRIIDRMFINPAYLDTLDKDTTPSIVVVLLLKLMCVNYSGKHNLSIKILTPNGKESDLLAPVPLVFEADKSGVQVRVDVNIGVKHEGRYWVVAYLEDAVITRTPLEMRFENLKR